MAYGRLPFVFYVYIYTQSHSTYTQAAVRLLDLEPQSTIQPTTNDHPKPLTISNQWPQFEGLQPTPEHVSTYASCRNDPGLRRNSGTALDSAPLMRMPLIRT